MVDGHYRAGGDRAVPAGLAVRRVVRDARDAPGLRNLRWGGVINRPDLAQQQQAQFARDGAFRPPGQRIDAGTAFYSCDISGRPYTASVTAVTVFSPLPASGGIWYMQSVWGFRAPRGNETAAQSMVDAMHASFAFNPQWMAQMKQVIQQRGQELRQQSAQQAQQFSAAMRQQFETQMANRQDAYMAMMNQQEADRNNAFNDHMRQKAWGQFNEMLYINDQRCLWNDAHTACVVVHN